MSSASTTHYRCIHLTVVGLTALCLLSIYIVFLADFPIASHYHSDITVATNTHTARRRLERLGRVVRHQQLNQRPSSPNASVSASAPRPSAPTPSAETAPRLQLQLTPRQELAALTSFLAAHEQHALPTETELGAPLNPELILDFDPSTPLASEELAQLQLDVWYHNPVVVFGKSLQPATRRLREALAEMDLRVDETVVELDTRNDGGIIESTLRRLLPDSSAQLPVLLLNGQHLRFDVREEGKDVLKAVLDAAGALKKRVPNRWHRELRRREARWSRDDESGDVEL
ncbi:unnamed protein product [Peniophora sp. CBMAI 1063]|nr:unnamed protein product [Peniophora sp. CBMAI 1063]